MYLSSHFSLSMDMRFLQITEARIFRPENYEFLLLQSGSIRITEEETSCVLSPGDVILLCPEHAYTAEALSSNFSILIRFEKEFIDTLIPPNATLFCCSALEGKKDYRELSGVLTEIAVEFPKGENENRLISLIYSLVDILQKNFIQFDDSAGSDIVSDRIRRIKSYIQQNYHRPLSLQELADRMYLSPQYLSKFIRQHMGITFIQYLNQQRMHHACEELLNTNHSITEIAFNNGFSNTSAFNKSFREIYHESPSAWRTAKKEETAKQPAPVIPQKLQKKFTTRSRHAQTYIRLGETESYYPSWSDTINIGSLTNALSSDFHRVFQHCQESIGFRYVRFEDIFSGEIMRPLENGTGFDYTNLNMILDFFQENHALPFIELGFKPRKTDLINFLSTPPSELFGPEKELSFYLSALEDLLCHCINRYGYAAVSSWRFELWMKHDEQLHYTVESPEEYVHRFKLYREIVKRLVPDALLGGPGHNSAGGRLPFIDVLEEMKRQNVYPDFFSIYIYCHTQEIYSVEGYAGDFYRMLSENPDIVISMFETYRDLIRQSAPSDIPLFITEFNCGINGNNYVSSSAFQGTFLCRNLLKIFRETRCVAYWHLSDAPVYTPQIPHQYSIDIGLIDSNGIPKPSFFAYVLLSRLSGRLIALGENYIATTDGSSRFQLLTYHYVHYNQQYSIHYQTPLSMEHTYDVFEETEAESVEFHLSAIPAGRYKMNKITLSREYGSMIDSFVRTYRDTSLSPEELRFVYLNMQESEAAYYFHTVRPKQEIYYYEIGEDERFSLSLDLSPHEVILIELTKKP